MFGPNVSSLVNTNINFHHREPRFFNVIKDIKLLFNEKFNLNNEFEILIQTGSGSLAIETVINSYNGKFNLVGAEGNFRSRWSNMLDAYNKSDLEGKQFHVQYETSKSIHNLEFDDNAFFVDGVSSFPYFSIPKSSKIFVTVSSKILGGSPVLGIILVHKSIIDDFIDENIETYLNVRRLVKFNNYDQTPTTPSLSLYVDFLKKLENFDLSTSIKNINMVSNMIVSHFGRDAIIGSDVGPVITLKPDVFIPSEVLKKFQLYGLNSIKKNASIQIFTYSEDISLYEELFTDLTKLKI
jgi:aspartate aminotransferase-like enzyme